MGKIKNVLLSALIITAMVGCSKELPVTKESSKESAAEIKKEAPKNNPGITKANYDKAIQEVSTIAEVEELMGEEPTYNTTDEYNGVTIYSATYVAFETGEILTFAFADGKLAVKSYKKN